MRNKPRIRFKGFTEDWEQREFSDIFAEVKSGLSRMLSNDDIGLPVVRANNINDGQLNLVDDIKYWYKNDPQGANTNNYLIEQGDILINFINSEAKMGTAAYVTRRPERDTIYTTNILRCKVNDEYNPYFIYSLTFLNSYKNYIASITKPAVNQASFTTVDFKKYSIKIPTVKEQNQIADLIETFNKLITLHQRKLEKLKLAKKALLQKLFPQNGSKFPELRFKGFADAWEQRKLGEVVKSYSGGTPTASNKEYYGGDIPFIRSAEINSDTTELYITQKGLDNSSAKIVEKGTILYAMYGATSGEVGISKINGAINQAILAMIPLNYDGKIIAQYLRKNKESIIGKYLQGGQGNLSANIILELPIQLPGLEESNQIAYFLESVDNIITLHQRKLDKLQEVKKGLLQKMFV